MRAAADDHDLATVLFLRKSPSPQHMDIFSKAASVGTLAMSECEILTGQCRKSELE